MAENDREADFQTGLEAYSRGNFAAALREWRLMAEQGHTDAQYNLGIMYANGRGAPQDNIEAVKWYRQAAEQGYTEAQYNLGIRYANGESVPRDATEAVKWFRRAAEKGLAGAQRSLGAMYANGEGAPQDHVQAYAWQNIAAAQGDELAKKNRKRIAESITREEIARAQKLAREYWEKYVLPFRN